LLFVTQLCNSLHLFIREELLLDQLFGQIRVRFQVSPSFLSRLLFCVRASVAVFQPHHVVEFRRRNL
jgi:hypothetical protein